MISWRSYVYRRNIITTSWSQFRAWLRLLEHTVVLACLNNNLYNNKRTTIPISTPVNTSHSQSTTEQDYASSMSLWVKTMFLKLRFVALAALFISVLKFELLITIHVWIKARAYTHIRTNIQTQNYKIHILQLDRLFSSSRWKAGFYYISLRCSSGEGEATEICGRCQVAVLSRMKAVRCVIDSTYL
jgi:hypothetical protein